MLSQKDLLTVRLIVRWLSRSKHYIIYLHFDNYSTVIILFNMSTTEKLWTHKLFMHSKSWSKFVNCDWLKTIIIDKNYNNKLWNAIIKALLSTVHWSRAARVDSFQKGRQNVSSQWSENQNYESVVCGNGEWWREQQSSVFRNLCQVCSSTSNRCMRIRTFWHRIICCT